MDLEAIESELRDVWAQISTITAAVAYPEVELKEFLSLKKEFEALQTEFQSLNVSDYLTRMSNDLEISADRILVVEEALSNLSREFKQFREVMLLRLNVMMVDRHANDAILASAFQRIWSLELGVNNLKRRVNMLDAIEDDELLNAIHEESLIMNAI